MKYLFIEPVSFLLVQSPVVGVPQLIGILENQGYEAKYIDLNNEFINFYSNKERYIRIINDKYDKYKTIELSGAPSIVKSMIEDKLGNVDETLLKHSVLDIANKLPLSVKIMKSKKLFYNKFLCEYAIRNVLNYLNYFREGEQDFVTRLIPSVASYRSYEEKSKFNLDIDTLKYYFDNKLSILDSFYEERVDEILKEKPSCIGLSVGIFTQFVSALLLAYKLKKKTKVHINIGGSFFNDFREEIENLNELFGLFFDSISLGDSTNTVTDILQYINNEIPIEEVSNLMYLSNGKIKINEQLKPVSYTKLPPASFTGYNFDNYFLPETIIPLKASSTCYWGKCIFCYCSGENNFSIKPVEKVVEEIEHIINKYKKNIFYFWDASVHPTFVNDLCDLILKKKLKIKFSIYARFEKEFDSNLFKKMKKAGCEIVYWGLDTASPRILEYINKGVDVNDAPKKLEQSKKAGIFNALYLILGHPTETIEDVQKTMNFVYKNIKNIHLPVVVEQVFFINNSIMYQNKEYYKKLIEVNLKTRIELVDKLEKDININKERKYYNLSLTAPSLSSQLYIYTFGVQLKSRFYESLYKLVITNKVLSQLYAKASLFLLKIF